MSEKTLQTSKKRLSNGKWSYRNYVLEKTGSKWNILDKDYFGDTKSEEVKKIESQKTIKDICAKIDEVLGDMPESSIKRKRAPKKKKIEETNELLEKARRIAYKIRWSLEEELQKDNENDDLINKLAIPLGPGKKIGNSGFLLTWNKELNKIELVIQKYQEEYTDAEFNSNIKNNKTELKVTIK